MARHRKIFFSAENKHDPYVVIVGRPNVGKSSLFNRMLSKRRALTHPQRGVTRDCLVESVQKEGFHFSLVDTGGFTLEKDPLFEAVRQKALEFIQRAELILFVLECESRTSEDEELAELLRPWSARVLLVVNKVDNQARLSDVFNHYQWGFSEPYPVSAEHGRGLSALFQGIFERLPKDPDHHISESHLTPVLSSQETLPLRIGILGRPNAGKSTLINALLGEERSLVSPQAGTTRDALAYSLKRQGQSYVLVDTAGVRRRGRVDDSLEYYSVHRSLDMIEEVDLVLLAIDSLDGLVEQDKKLVHQVVRRLKPLIFVLTKWDLQEDLPHSWTAYMDRLRFFIPAWSFIPAVAISAPQGRGLKRLFRLIEELSLQRTQQLSTAQLNNALRYWVVDQVPPGGFKLKYMTQFSLFPPRFMIFVNRVKDFPQSYLRYIENKIRLLGYKNLPFEICLKDEESS